MMVVELDGLSELDVYCGIGGGLLVGPATGDTVAVAVTDAALALSDTVGVTLAVSEIAALSDVLSVDVKLGAGVEVALAPLVKLAVLEVALAVLGVALAVLGLALAALGVALTVLAIALGVSAIGLTLADATGVNAPLLTLGEADILGDAAGDDALGDSVVADTLGDALMDVAGTDPGDDEPGAGETELAVAGVELTIGGDTLSDTLPHATLSVPTSINAHPGPQTQRGPEQSGRRSSQRAGVTDGVADAALTHTTTSPPTMLNVQPPVQ